MRRYLGLLKQHASPIPVVNVWRMWNEIPLPDAKPGLPPVLVMGGDRDLILDKQALKDTAAHFGTEAVIMPDMAHDCMLVRFLPVSGTQPDQCGTNNTCNYWHVP